MSGPASAVRASLWTVPLVFAAWRFANVIFGETQPFGYAYVTDGFQYIDIARKFLESVTIDAYRVSRIAPSGIIHAVFGVLDVAYNNPNIILGFRLLNLVSLCTAVYAVDRILRHFEVGSGVRELGLVLLVVNYPMLKYSVFYPVLTDFSAIGLASLLLLFYVERREWAVVATTLVGAFTWPMLLYQGLILMVLPVQSRESERVPRVQRNALSAASAGWGLALIAYFVVVRELDVHSGSIRLEPVYVALAAVFLLPMYFFLPTMLFQKDFFDLRWLKSQITWERVFVAFVVFDIYWFSKNALIVRDRPSPWGGLDHFLGQQIIYGVARPLINIVAHTTFYGCLTLLVMIFWKRFGEAVARCGLGLVLAFLLNFYLILMGSESRHISNLLPWFVVFLCVALRDERLPRYFARGVLVANFAISKVWLPVGNPWKTDRETMSMGPWMSEPMWLLQLAAFAVLGAILFFSLFRVRLGEGLAIERAPGFRPVELGTGSATTASIPLALWITLAAAAPVIFSLLRAVCLDAG